MHAGTYMLLPPVQHDDGEDTMGTAGETIRAASLLAAVLCGVATSSVASLVPPAAATVAVNSAPVSVSSGTGQLLANLRSPAAEGLPSPEQSSSDLLSESCASKTFCVAVGSYFDAGTRVPLIDRWNGTHWTKMSVLLPPGLARFSSDKLDGVSCATTNFCMAVGDENGQAITAEWNGTSWSYLPVSVESYPTLAAVSCPISTECVAVGQYDGEYGDQALALVWTQGSSWTQLTPQLTSPVGETAFSGVFCQNSAACMAVGSYVPMGQTLSEPFSEEDVLGVWQIDSVPAGPFGASTVAASVSCGNFSSCVAVGYTNYSNSDAYRATSYSWNGSSWTSLPTPQPASVYDELLSVSCQSGSTPDCEAVGLSSGSPFFSSQSLAMSLDGGKWSLRRSVSPAEFQVLEGVSCPTASFCQVAGWSGSVEVSVATAEHLTPASAALEKVPGETALEFEPQGISCASATACMEVGYYLNGESSSAVSQWWNGHGWRTISLPDLHGVFTALEGVACTSPSHCVAVGSAGFGLLERDVTSREPPSQALDGGYGLVAVWNGKQWTVTELFGDAPYEGLNAVSCWSPSSCVAVGQGYGFAFSYAESNGRWKAYDMPQVTEEASPSSVACTSATNCEAVGDGAGSATAFAAHWNGSKWTLQPLPSTGNVVRELTGVSCPSAHHCVAVGALWTDSSTLRDLALTWNGSRWKAQTTPSPEPSDGLAAVSCSANSFCLAVGPVTTTPPSPQNGIILQWNGATWTASEPSAANGIVTLDAVDAVSKARAVAVGLTLTELGFSRVRLVESGGQWTRT